MADLNSLTETEVERDGKRFLLRSPPQASSFAPPASLRRSPFGNSETTDPRRHSEECSAKALLLAPKR